MHLRVAVERLASRFQIGVETRPPHFRLLRDMRPRSWIGSLAIGVVFGIAFKLLMKTIVMPLLGAPESIPPTITSSETAPRCPDWCSR